MPYNEFADVSVIIPAYRSAATIGRALSSVAGQTLKPRRVIVVDDGSDDDTAAAAGAFAGRMNGITLSVVRQQNKGAGAARNRALAETSSEYVAFLDADDEWMPEKIARSMVHLEGTGHVLVAHDIIRVEPDGQKRVIECAKRFGDTDDPFVQLYRRGFIATTTVVARRDAVLAAGGFDETLATAQDFDLWLKMLGGGNATFTVFPEVLACYHYNDNGITSNTARRLACTLRISVRHYPALRERPGSALVSLWVRIAAVHYEAVCAYRQAGRAGTAIKTVFVLPWRLLWAAMNTPGSSRCAPDWFRVFLWFWVIAGFAAYAYRFKYLGLAFLKMVMGL